MPWHAPPADLVLFSFSCFDAGMTSSIAERDILDTLAWSLLHQAPAIRSAAAAVDQPRDLSLCRARLQLEHLRRAGVLTLSSADSRPWPLPARSAGRMTMYAGGHPP